MMPPEQEQTESPSASEDTLHHRPYGVKKKRMGAADLSVKVVVDGADQSTAQINRFAESLGQTESQAKQATAALASSASATSAVGTATKQATTATEKQVPALARAASMYKRATDAAGGWVGQLGKAGNIVNGFVGLLGPWGAAIAGITSAFTVLSGLLADTSEAVEINTEKVSQLAAAYRSLGEAATIEAAKAKVAAEQAANIELEERIELESRLEAMAGQYERDLRRQAEIQEGIRSGQYELMGALSGELENLQKRVELYESMQEQARRFREEESARVLAAQKAEDEAIDREHQLNYIREQSEAKRKAAQEAQARAAQAAAAAAARARSEQQALLALETETAQKRWESEGHTAVETIERTFRLRQEQLEKSFTDAAKRTKALEALEVQRVLAVAEAEKQAAEKLAAEEEARTARRQKLDQAAGSISVVGGASESAVGKAEAAWAKQREKLLADLEKILQLQAQYRQEYTSEELAKHTQYLALRSAELDAARQLEQAQLQAYSAISEARRQDMEADQEATFTKLANQRSLSKSTKQALSAQMEGFEAMAGGLEQWGVASTAVNKMQMVAAGIQAGADAIDYGARSLAYFASGNPVAGAGMAAAAVGKTAAAAAYAAGVMELGGSPAPTRGAAVTAASSGSASASTLTGSSPQQSQEVHVTFSYEGSDSQIATALMRGMNATSRTLGGQKLSSRTVRGR